MQGWYEVVHFGHDVREDARKIAMEEITKEVTDTLNRLNSILIDSGRLDDLARATKDTEYQQKLMEELLPEKDSTKS